MRALSPASPNLFFLLKTYRKIRYPLRVPLVPFSDGEPSQSLLFTVRLQMDRPTRAETVRLPALSIDSLG